MCSACLAQSALSPPIGCTALFCGSPRSTVSCLRFSPDVGGEHHLTVSSHCIHLHLHCSPHSHAQQAKRKMGLYYRHGRFWLGQQRLFFSARVRYSACYGKREKSKLLTVRRFLSVAWTMTDYDGTTQYVSPMALHVSHTNRLFAQHVGGNARCRDPRPSGDSSCHSGVWSRWLDANGDVLLLHVRLRRHHVHTDRSSRCADLFQRWRQNRWDHHVVFCNAGAVLHRLLCHAG